MLWITFHCPTDMWYDVQVGMSRAKPKSYTFMCLHKEMCSFVA